MLRELEMKGNQAEVALQRRIAEVIWSQARPVDIQEVRPKAQAEAGLNVYLHIGFCEKRCDFCDFKILVGPPPAVVESYAESLRGLIKHTLPFFVSESSEVHQIYCGGGTPSILSKSQIEQLMMSLGETVDLGKTVMTFEMHPKHVTSELTRLLKNLGVGRFSMGLQSLVEADRMSMGRAGTTVEQDTNAILLLKDAGLPFNVDIIYGTPGHTMDSWEQTLERLISLVPPEVTLYQYIQTPGSKFNTMLSRGKVTKPGIVQRWHMYETAREKLLRASYVQDSTFGFNRIENDPTRQQLLSRDDCLGLGPGAYSRIGRTFFVNTASIRSFAEGEVDQYWGVTIPEWLNRVVSGVGDTMSGREGARQMAEGLKGLQPEALTWIFTVFYYFLRMEPRVVNKTPSKSRAFG